MHREQGNLAYQELVFFVRNVKYLKKILSMNM